MPMAVCSLMTPFFQVGPLPVYSPSARVINTCNCFSSYMNTLVCVQVSSMLARLYKKSAVGFLDALIKAELSRACKTFLSCSAGLN